MLDNQTAMTDGVRTGYDGKTMVERIVSRFDAYNPPPNRFCLSIVVQIGVALL